ncbi:MAG: Mur ligase family protein [Candidatus Roizmanbacteria bacterium]|nr:Mur ligase family protein [Candidatus Roizmanbacteria bacterium]
MFHTIAEIEKYLEKFIYNNKLSLAPGDASIMRTKELLRLLDSPQNKLKVIHVAGTSGKGSTSFMISSFLIAHGLRVGLHLSPHLMDIRERTEINNGLIEEKKYLRYFEEIVPFVEKMRDSSYGKLTYFELMVVFVFYVFEKEKVDYAIVEVGMGGLYDGTNVVERSDKLAVISKIGFDHIKALGNTLAKIAYHKGMICPEQGEMISIYQTASVEKEFKKIADRKKSQLSFVEKTAIKHIAFKNGKTTFTFQWKGKEYVDLAIGLLGFHQAQNAALALATVFHLGLRDKFKIDIQSIRSVSENLRFKGRMDFATYNRHLMILDGAHNVQKMKAFLKTVKTVYPNKKFTFVIAFKHGKEYMKMVRLMIPFAHTIIATTIFSDNPDFGYLSTKAEEIRDALKQSGFENVVIAKTKSDIKKLIHTNDGDMIATGSLYLISDLYALLNI